MKRFALVVAVAFLAHMAAFAQTDVAPKPGGGGGTPAVKAAPPALKLAVVDLTKIYNKWEKVKDFADKLAEKKKAQEAELKAMQKELKEKVVMRDTEGVSEAVRISLETEIVQIEAKAKYVMEAWNQQVKRQLDEGIAKYFEEIRTEVAEYAKANGYTLVLKTETDAVGEDKENASMVAEKIARVLALYVDPGFDITDDILSKLDDKYKKEKAANPPPVEPPKEEKKDGK